MIVSVWSLGFWIGFQMDGLDPGERSSVQPIFVAHDAQFVRFFGVEVGYRIGSCLSYQPG